MSNMTTSPTRCFVHLLNGARKSCIIVGLAIIILGLVEYAEAATYFCQKTAQDALQGCQDAAESGRSVAQGKCDNVSDPIARADCRKQAAADFQDALQTCQDGYASREAACQKFGPARYDTVIDPANFVRHVTNPVFPLPPGQTFDDGRPVTVEGSFTAGVNGDKPGIIMEAHSVPGDFYRQEFALATAEDNALVVSLDTTVKVPAGLFHHCLKTQETTPLEPDALEN